MSLVWLVRHGEAAASWGEHADPGLSDTGYRQAEAAADALQQCLPGGVEVVSSPKARALETAAPLASRLKCGVQIVDAFREIDAPVPLADRQAWLRGFMKQTWDQQGDPLWQWRGDIIAALQALTVPTVVFTHFLVINTVVAHCRREQETVQCWPDNGSIHHFECGGTELSVVRLGQEMRTVVN